MDQSPANSANSDQPASTAPPSPAGSGPAPQPPKPKEEDLGGAGVFKEAEPRRIEQREFKPPPEVKEYVKLVKKEEIRLPRPVKDEYGQVLIESAMPSRPKINLPLNTSGIKKGVKQKVTDSVRWLATLCLRIIKMFPERVLFPKR